MPFKPLNDRQVGAGRLRVLLHSDQQRVVRRGVEKLLTWDTTTRADRQTRTECSRRKAAQLDHSQLRSVDSMKEAKVQEKQVLLVLTHGVAVLARQ
jgi:hypothetical protein